MSLPDILAAEQRAHKALSRNRQLAEFKREVANYTYIRALEVKFSYANGWHPHLHELLFFDRPLTKQETTKFTSLVESVWIESVTKSLGRSPKAGVAANLITLPNGDASQYVTKMSAYICKTDGSHDDKPTHSYEPLELLQQGKVAKWQEFATAMKGKRSIVASVDLLKDLLFKEIWNMTLAEITEYEAEQTGAAIPEPPRIEWSLALEANLLYYVTSDYRIARSLYEAAEAGREAVELWARDTTDQTTYNAVQGLKYCRGSKDLLASTKPLADLLAPPVRPRNPVALTADEWKQNHDLNLAKLEAAREKSHKDLPEWIREPF
jgi:hypothetical protein